MNAPNPDKYIAEHDGVYKLELNNEEDDYGDYVKMTNQEIVNLLNDCDNCREKLHRCREDYHKKVIALQKKVHNASI